MLDNDSTSREQRQIYLTMPRRRLSKRRFILRKYNVFFQTFLFTFGVGAVTALSDKRKILPDRSDLRNFPTFSYLRLRLRYSRSAMFKIKI